MQDLQLGFFNVISSVAGFLYRIGGFHHIAFNVASFLYNFTLLDDTVNYKNFTKIEIGL